jgi:hypothetical protein
VSSRNRDRTRISYRIGEKFSAKLAYEYNDFDLPIPGGDFTLDL